ncbi:MAG: hypothetical protein ACO1QB_18445 [Verrucomicrobiales bacterium]
MVTAKKEGQGKTRSTRKKKTASAPASTPIPNGFLTNRHLAELLCLEGEKAEGHTRKALIKAAHSAFIWQEEAASLVTAGRSLTELPSVGPFLAKKLHDWITTETEVSVPPPIRQNFLTMAECGALLQEHPDWRVRLKGDLQMHSEWSDGSGTITEMAEAGIGRGYSYISITDHTKGLKIAGGIGEKQLAEQWAEIDALNKRLKVEGKDFHVLKSVEMNLAPDGSGDMDSDCLAELDLVLGSFHSALRKTEDQTSRYLAALNNPNIQILGHPRGRVYNYRLGLTADWPTIFAEAARLDKAIEVDAYADRQDLDLELLQLARDAGVRISLGSDAHHPWQLMFLDLALAATLLAGIPAERIINFMPLDELLAWVSKVRRG